MLFLLHLFFAVILAVEAVDVNDILANYPELQKCLPTYKMFDASGKLPSGIMSGNFVDLGNFDQCLEIREKNSKSKEIKGKYCIMQLALPVDKRKAELSFRIFGKTYSILPERPDQEIVKHQERMIIQGLHPSDNCTGLILGWCVPHICPIKELALVVTTVLEKIDPDIKVVPVMGGLCQTKHSLKNDYNTGNVILIMFLVLTLFGIILSTLYDMYFQFYEKNPTYIILTAFSVKTNGPKLFSVANNPDQLSCLYGIRFLSMMWVVYCHRFRASISNPMINLNYINDWVHNPINMYIVNAPLAVDTFLVLSGILVAYGYCLAKEKDVRFNFFFFYLHRYIRLTPVLAVLVWFHATIIDYFGSGPFWPLATGPGKETCIYNWWTSLLYIQNYYNPLDMCIGQTWYLAVDMQLFILSPIILIPLWRWPKRTLLVSAVFVLVSMATSFAATYINDLKAFFNIDAYDNDKFMESYYLPTHTRYGPWLMGIMLGYYLFKLRENKDDRITLHISQVAFGWIVSIGLLLTTLFAGHHLAINPYRLGNSFFNGFHRHGWAVGICWVIYACTQGYGGPINTLLSWSLFQILSRFTYAIYLVHGSIVNLIISSSNTNTYYSDFDTMHAFWGDFMISLLISICLTLAYESPMVVLENVLLKTEHKPVKPKLSAHHSSVDVGIWFSDIEASL